MSRTKFDGKEGEWYKKEKLLQNKEEPARGTEERKPPLQYRVKTDTGGGKRFFANAQNDRLVERRALRMTAESRNRTQNDSWVER